MTSREIRQSFLDFFRERGHRIVPSAPVVPLDDPTLLFTNAGMNQFKDVFLNTGSRDYTRAADTQKCIRVSGKHNDLEEVGRDTYHHTFFEMLGNWSFGDYYKKEAIAWAWELLTGVWGLPKDRLYATVYTTDDEAFEYWKTETDIDHSHILRFDEKTNFWEMGDVGPCGPCSEIHIDMTPDKSGAGLVNADRPEVMEIWNLVFIQYSRDESGELHALPKRHIDTGMGFERICAVLQGKTSNYDTDIFRPLIRRIEELSGRAYEGAENEIAMRVIADHARMLTFAITDGAVPSNEGRGYVLRRILRRASRFGRNLGMREPFLFKIVEAVVARMGDVFPEIAGKRETVENIIRAEEESFNATLDRGLEIFEHVVARVKQDGSNRISGAEAFKLYDTYGFPLDLTTLMARERGLEVDESEFEKHMSAQKTRSRNASKSKFTLSITGKDRDIELELAPGASATAFTGYDALEAEAKIIGLRQEDGKAYVVVDQTPFYVESGGQVSDTGVIEAEGHTLPVSGVARTQGTIIHLVPETDVDLHLSEVVRLQVDAERRKAIMRNHSATHLLHSALRAVLGSHVQQAGSLVEARRLRFDFSHYDKLTDAQIRDIEALVNEKIREAIPRTHLRDLPFEEARKMGALMFFGDKYGDRVNVVQFGDFSLEFCGGTHVANTAEIGLFKIVSESSIASGTRRIEAVTGTGVEEYIRTLHDDLVEARTESEALQARIHELEKELARLSLEKEKERLSRIITGAPTVRGVRFVAAKVRVNSHDALKALGDVLREKLRTGVGILASEIDGKIGLVCVVTDDLIESKKWNAGNIVGAIAKDLGGGGGGRPHLATAGAKDLSRLDEVLEHAREYLPRD